MRLRAIRQRFDKKNDFPKTRATPWQWGGMLLFGVTVVVLGAGVAIFPASFMVKLGFVIAATFVFIVALLAPGDAQPPEAFLRFLLYAVTALCAIWPSYLTYHGLPGPGVNPTRLVYWSLAGLWLFWWISSRDLREQTYSRVDSFRPFLVMLFVYLAWSLVCAVTSDSPAMSSYYLTRLMVGPIFILFVALSCLRNKKDVDLVLLLMVIGALFACGIGMLEATKKGNVFYDLVPSLFPKADTEEGAAWVENLVKDKSRGGAYRVMSTFSHPLTFGEYLAISFPLSVYIAGYARRRWQRFVGVITVPAILAGVYVSHTRSSILAIAVALIAIVGIFALRAVGRRRAFGAAVVGTFSLVAILLSIIPLISISLDLAAGQNAGEVGSSVARLVMLKRGISLVLDSPLLGYGPGLAAYTLGLLPGITHLTIDSYYLSLAMESGFPGLLLFLGMLVFLLAKGFRASLQIRGRDGIRISVIVSALLSFSVVKTVLSLTQNFDMVFLLIALLAISLEPENASLSTNLQGTAPTGNTPSA